MNRPSKSKRCVSDVLTDLCNQFLNIFKGFLASRVIEKLLMISKRVIEYMRTSGFCCIQSV